MTYDMDFRRPVAEHPIVPVLGMRVDNIRSLEAIERVQSFVDRRSNDSARKVFFANVHTFQIGWRDEQFRKIVNDADLVLPDGSGLRIAGTVFGTPILENMNGTDFTPRILANAERYGLGVYLLGAKQEVLDQCRFNIEKMFPELNITGSHCGFHLTEDDALIMWEIAHRDTDIILVALGSPSQEKWITDHAGSLHGGVLIGVGGLFDFLAGYRKRAPEWFRRNGVEWAYRFWQDPLAKWKRVFVEIPLFLGRVVLERTTSRYRKSSGTDQKRYA